MRQHAFAGNQAVEAVHEAGVRQLISRHVDGDVHRLVACEHTLPDAHLADGFGQHHVPDFADHARLLCHADEFGGLQKPSRRVTPAGQRFEAHHIA